MRRGGTEILDEREQPPAEVARFLLLDVVPRAAERLAEAIAVERLQQIVERAHLERPERVLVVSRDEDDHAASSRRRSPLNDLEAVGAGHLDVEEDEIGLKLLDGGDGFEAVAALAEELDAPPRSAEAWPRVRARAARRPR